MMLRRIMWRSMMNRKITNVDVAEDEVELDDVEDHEVKEEEDDDVEAQDRTHTLREPAQSTCTSTSHKSHFIRKFTGKMPRPSWSTLIKHRPLHLP